MRDIVTDFLYWNPLGGGFPDATITIGVNFEVGGTYEDWGFVVNRNGETYSSGRSLATAIERARQRYANEQGDK